MAYVVVLDAGELDDICQRRKRRKQSAIPASASLSLSFPLPLTLRPPPPLPASPDLSDPAGPAHPRRRDSRREVSAGRTRSPAEEEHDSGAGCWARLRPATEPRRGRAVGRASRSSISCVRRSRPGLGLLHPRRPGIWQQRLTQTEHHVGGRASATPAS